MEGLRLAHAFVPVSFSKTNGPDAHGGSERQIQWSTPYTGDSIAAQVLLQFLHCLVDGERRRPLARRKLLECLQKFADDG